MNLLLGLYALTILSNNGATALGTSDTDVQCAAAMGYVSRMIETQEGGTIASDFLINGDSFSLNYNVGGTIVTLTCDREVI